MCFSATASFTVGAGLMVPGYVALKRTKSPGMLLYASTPILFCFHQVAEGFLWLSLTNPDFAAWYKPALYGYSFISQPIWPIWAPLTIWLMETDKSRKKIISYFLLLGAAAALYMFYCLVTYNISAVAEHGHIRYYRDFPYLDIMRPINFVAIGITPFLSTLRYTKLVAVAMMTSLILSYVLLHNYFISIWCFFAAILSVLIILVVNANRKIDSGTPLA
ncbi:MAG: DUF6629 family protein [Bacteroidota bacterium]